MMKNQIERKVATTIAHSYVEKAVSVSLDIDISTFFS